MDDKEKLKEEILDLIDTDLWDRELLPHYGLWPAWYERYMALCKLVWKYVELD